MSEDDKSSEEEREASMYDGNKGVTNNVNDIPKKGEDKLEDIDYEEINDEEVSVDASQEEGEKGT